MSKYEFGQFLFISLHLLGKSWFHCHLLISASIQVIMALQWQKWCITLYMQFLASFNHIQLFYLYLQSFYLNFRFYSNVRLTLLRKIKPNLTKTTETHSRLGWSFKLYPFWFFKFLKSYAGLVGRTVNIYLYFLTESMLLYKDYW